MKQKLLILCLLLIGFQQVSAQSSSQIESFINNVLPQHSQYFSNATLTANNQLQLTATEKYNLLALSDKKTIMNQVINSWNQTLIIVQFETSREIWTWNNTLKNAILIDSWNYNATKPAEAKLPATQRDLHPWFFYIGGTEAFDSGKNVNGALNTHVGVFLLQDKWDMAVSFSEAISGNVDANTLTGQMSLGLMSRIYFPLKNKTFSPNLGAQLALISTTNSGSAAVWSLKPTLLLGARWYVGIGSFDIGVNIGNGFTTMIGYTFIPKINTNKKKK